MNNKLKEFEELLLENTLFKVYNHALEMKTRSGRNGGESFKSSQRNKFKKTWN